MIPILMITYNRLEYTKKALDALLAVKGIRIIIIDNGSTDGTQEWFKEMIGTNLQRWGIYLNAFNIGIAGAMNKFLNLTDLSHFVGKVDNDTIVPPDFIERMLPHMAKADIVQAKHPLIAASGVGTFDEWTSKMPADGALRFNHFVGGSGVLFKRQLVDRIPETEWKLGGWREFQRQNPQLKKAFALDCEIELLDEGGYPKEYESYYKSTGRL